MVNKIFRSNFFTSMLILLMSFCLIFGVLFGYFEAQMFTELESEAGYISYAVKNEGTDFIDNFNEKGKRITLVSSDGTVLADTKADAEELENHADRKEINLSFKEYSLLIVLLEAEGNVVSRDTLLTRVWGEFYDESRTLDVHIRKLRIKLETAGELIHTVKNIGYKLGGNENG